MVHCVKYKQQCNETFIVTNLTPVKMIDEKDCKGCVERKNGFIVLYLYCIALHCIALY